MAFLKEIEHLEHAEHSDNAECPYRSVDAKRNDTQQIDNSEEAEHIFLWSRMAVDTQYELGNEERLDNILQHLHRGIAPTFNDETVYHYQKDTECYHRNEDNIKEPSHRRIRAEYHCVDLVLQRLIVPQFLYSLL